MKKIDKVFFKTLLNSELRITIPTVVTMVRIALTPVIVYTIACHAWGTAFVWLFIAAITDMVDGALARWWNEKTLLGACLDPIADKLLLISCFFTLACTASPLCALPAWLLMLIIARESIIVLGSALLLANNKGFSIAPTWLGKLTTTVELAFILWVLCCSWYGWLPLKTYVCSVSALATLMIVSLAQYMTIGLRYLFTMAEDI